MNRILLLSAALALIAPVHGQFTQWPDATIEVTIRNEEGTAMSDVRVTGVFWKPNEKSNSATVAVKRVTNKNGFALVHSRTNGACGCWIYPPTGYYESSINTDFDEHENGRWLPSPRKENVIVKKIGTPVPMYAVSRWRVVLPGAEGSFGFDLEKLDWVAPHGAGVIADLVFTQEKRIDNVLGSSATLRITFSNSGDGLIPLYELKGPESELNLPRTAPVEGYEAERRLTTTWKTDREHTPPAKPALGYIFRVRTILDESGREKSALHGKIDGEFKWDPKNLPTGEVTFTYYLNPDGTTNLEFDRKRNLFGELPVENTVHRP